MVGHGNEHGPIGRTAGKELADRVQPDVSIRVFELIHEYRDWQRYDWSQYLVGKRAYIVIGILQSFLKIG